MEVKPGYKQTEVGVIPEDWRMVRLGDIAVIKDGTHQTPKYVPFGVPFYSVEQVTSGNFSDTKYISPEEHKFLTRSCKIEKGDLLMTRIGSIGDCKLIDWEVDASFYVSLALLKIHGASAGYVEQYSKSLSFTREVELHSLPSAIPKKINLGPISDIRLPIPSPDEQYAIATALGDMDALLDGLDRLIAKKRAIKQATIQQLLTGQTRLPGFSGDWEVKRLEDLADIRSGGTPSTGDARAWDGTIPWCTPTDITALEGRKYLTTTSRAITEHGLGTSSAELIPARSIVMTSRATIGECAINAVPVTTNQGFKNLVPHDSVDVEFLYYLLSTQTQGLIGLSAGSTFLEIGKTQLRQYEVKLPAEKDEQTAIATVLSYMDAEITALETRRAKTRALKQALMQELLTGRTRLVMPDAKPVGEEAAQTEGRKANVHFLRSVLAAEILDQLHDQPTFGHVKFEKMMFLAEHLCQVDTGSTYHRKAAGPYDNRALRSIDSQLQKQQWFEARKQEGRYQYVPLVKRGGHKPYFERNFSGIGETLEKILSAFKTAKTEQCEIVATLLAAWSDLLREKGTVSDEMIVHEVLHNWHEAKQRIPEDRWLVALGWMREKGFVPKGATLP